MAEDSAYAEQFRRAIEDFWSVRARQGVRAGQHLDKLAELVGDIFVDEGFAEGNVLRRRGLDFPGYYRSEKRWDLLVIYKNVLAAAIEFKSQVGSVGKNINNRVEEAVGSATDVRAAHREGRFGIVRPWLGYLLLLEDARRSASPCRRANPFFSVEEVFRETSYKDRYEIFSADWWRKAIRRGMFCNVEARCGRSARRASIRSYLYCVASAIKERARSSGRAARRVVSFLAEFRAGLDLIHFASLNALTLDEAEPLPSSRFPLPRECRSLAFFTGRSEEGRLPLRLRDHYETETEKPTEAVLMPETTSTSPAPPTPLLDALRRLLLSHRPAFSQERTFFRAQALILAHLFCFARRTITQALIALGLTDYDWSAFYRIFGVEGRIDF